MKKIISPLLNYLVFKVFLRLSKCSFKLSFFLLIYAPLLSNAQVVPFGFFKTERSTNGSSIVNNYSISSATGSMTAGTAVTSVTQTLIATVTKAGTYSIQATANGVTFSGMGNLALGTQNIILTAFGTPLAGGNITFTLNTSIPLSYKRFTTAYCGSGPTTLVEVYNPVTGKTWMDRNLGASRKALSKNDAQAYGDLYQWGRGNDGHQCRNSNITTTLSSNDKPDNDNFILNNGPEYDWRSPSNNVLWNVAGTAIHLNMINNPCPIGYRVPLNIELKYESDNFDRNANGAFSSLLKLPLPGFRSNDVGELVLGFDGVYASNQLHNPDPNINGGVRSPRILYFDDQRLTNLENTAPRNIGFSVRCIKGEPTSNGTAVFSVNGSTRVGTMNLGAAVTGVSQEISVTVTKSGTYDIITKTVNGITFSGTGTLATGSQNITLTASGTPTSTASTTSPKYFPTINTTPIITFSRTINNADGSAASPPPNPFPSPDFDVTSPATGKVWNSKNLGALRVAQNNTDIYGFGNLYQWGRASDGHQFTNSLNTNIVSSGDQPSNSNFIAMTSDWRSSANNNLWQGVSGINNPCSNGYRLPTASELDAERASWATNDAAGAFASPLKLPLAGYRSYEDGSVNFVGIRGAYWTSTIVGDDISKNLIFDSTNAIMNTDDRAAGCAIRCIKD